MHEVLVNRLGGLSLPRKSVVRLTDRPDMTLDVYRGHKTTMQQQQQQLSWMMLFQNGVYFERKTIAPPGSILAKMRMAEVYPFLLRVLQRGSSAMTGWLVGWFGFNSPFRQYFRLAS